MRYRIRLEPDDNGTMLVTAPDFPEVSTYGQDEGDAKSRALDAIETAIMARMADRLDIPRPSKRRRGDRIVELPLIAAAKVALYQEMRRQDYRKADLARALGVHPPQIDRLLNLNHDSRLDQISAAFKQLGKRVEITVSDAAA